MHHLEAQIASTEGCQATWIMFRRAFLNQINWVPHALFKPHNTLVNWLDHIEMHASYMIGDLKNTITKPECKLHHCRDCFVCQSVFASQLVDIDYGYIVTQKDYTSILMLPQMSTSIESFLGPYLVLGCIAFMCVTWYLWEHLFILKTVSLEYLLHSCIPIGPPITMHRSQRCSSY